MATGYQPVRCDPTGRPRPGDARSARNANADRAPALEGGTKVDGGRVREGGRRKRWALMVSAFPPPAFTFENPCCLALGRRRSTLNIREKQGLCMHARLVTWSCRP